MIAANKATAAAKPRTFSVIPDICMPTSRIGEGIAAVAALTRNRCGV
jgi:hypothetical protein